ncbi:MAG: Ig-like domain-containing protein [Oscillospiraceae bacterium]|nr:Ig-like domain-containing protein [Oscillospiraceae bacterium]
MQKPDGESHSVQEEPKVDVTAQPEPETEQLGAQPIGESQPEAEQPPADAAAQTEPETEQAGAQPTGESQPEAKQPPADTAAQSEPETEQAGAQPTGESQPEAKQPPADAAAQTEPETEQAGAQPTGESQPEAEQPPADTAAQPEPTSASQRFPKIGYLAIAALTVLLVGVLWLALPGGERGGISVTPLIYDETGIAPNTSFLITLPGVPELAEAREMIDIQPVHPFRLMETDQPGVFELTQFPLTPFEKNSELTITVAGQAFAFAVRNELIILEVFPHDQARGVSVTTAIYLRFNSDSVQSLFDSMSVFRSRDGHYEDFRVLPQEGDTVRIMPTHPLRPETVYRIVISPPLEDATGAQLLVPFEFTFTTGREDGHDSHERAWFSLSGDMTNVNVIAGDVPALSAQIDGYLTPEFPDVSVTVRAIGSWEAYYVALSIHDTASIEGYDARTLPVVAAFEVTPEPLDWWRSLIVFPEELPAGWYHVEVTAGSEELAIGAATRSILMQVSEISVFYMTTGDEAIVWAHDVNTGRPLAGADIHFDGDFVATGRTDQSGVAVISGVQFTEQDARLDQWQWVIDKRFTVTDGERVFVAGERYGDHFRDSGASEGQRRYISYVYTDRQIYRTTDTIRVWGMVRPRGLSGSLPSGLTLNLRESRVSQPITLLPDGTFMAEIELANIAVPNWSWETLALETAAGDVIFSDWLTINDFVAPVFRTDAVPDAPVFLLGETDTVSAAINVSLFDGTPAPAYPLRVDPWNRSWGVTGFVLETGNLITDPDGNLPVDFRIIETLDSWRPQSYTFGFSGEAAADEQVTGVGSIMAIHRDVMLTGSFDRAANTLEVNTHAIDISRVTDAHSLWDHEVLRGRPLSQPGTVSINRVYFAREITGTFYDRVHRVNRNSYRFVRQEEVVEVREFETVGGRALLTDLPRPGDGEFLYAMLNIDDSRGLPVNERVGLGWGGDRFLDIGGTDDGIHRYSLTLNHDPAYHDSAEDERVFDEHFGQGWGGSEWWRFYGNRESFVDGQNVSFSLRNNADLVEDTSGFILSAVVQDGFASLRVTQGNQISLPFDEGLLPNYLLTGAFFDGRHIFELGNTYMSFNPERRELELTLEQDRAAYSPGDELALTVRVTERFTGQPAAGAIVLLSVVDEAIFAVREQHVDFIRTLYRDVFFPRIHHYTSFTQFRNFGQGGGGGGDDHQIRRDFPDTAHFAAAHTDEAGIARITVGLPDSVTSWRLTSLALTPDNMAGNARANAIVTLDYFVTPIVNQTLLAGDSFVVGLYSAGVGVDDNDPVSYHVRLTGEGIDLVREAAGTVRGYLSVDFGPLDLGEYTVTVEGRSGGHRDTVELPVQVIRSGIEVSRVETFNLSDGIEIDPLRWPVSVVLYSENARTYNAVFRTVVSRAWGSWRTEARLARRFIATQDSWHSAAFGQEDITDLHSRWSFLRPLPHAAENIELTVLAHLALPDFVELPQMQIDFDDTQHSGRGSAIFAARALAGQEIGVSLRDYMAQGAGLDYIDRIYLAMAMYISGDAAGAREWYNTLVTAQLSEHPGLAGDIALSVADGRMDANQTTAAALMLATLMGHQDAHGLALYLTRHQPRGQEPLLLEMIYYLRQFAPTGGSTASFSYQIGGQTITRELTSGFYRLTLSRDEFAAASFETLTGQVYADVYFVGDPSTDESNRLIGLTKTLTPVDGVFEPGALVRITLTPDLSAFDLRVGDTGLVMDDYIPTGMRFERFAAGTQFAGGTHGTGWWLRSRQGQRLQFGSFGIRPGPIVYYARIATPGEYVVERAFISSATADTWGASERDVVTIDN